MLRFNLKQRLLFVALCLSLAACSGGGGSTTSSSIPAAQVPQDGTSSHGRSVPGGTPSPSPVSTLVPRSAALSNQETYKGINIFDTSSPYTQDISNSPADANSTSVINNQGGIGFNPGGGFINGVPIETFNVATSATPTYTATCRSGWCPPVQYPGGGNNSAGPIPWTSSYGWETCCGDSHAFVVDSDTKFDYEMYGFAFTKPNGPLASYNGMRWNLGASLQSQYMNQHVTADAAGLPMIAGALIADRDCCASNADANTFINHAVAFGFPTNTLGAHTANWGYFRPASAAVAGPGTCSTSCGSTSLYYGDRLRLKANFTLACTAAGTCPQATSIVAALKRYGMFYEDQSPSQFFILFAANEGTVSSSNWNTSDLRNLSAVNIASFEIVQRSTPLCYSGHSSC